MFAKVYRLHRVQTLPISIDECWAFFSNPLNLPKITPPWLRFEILPETGSTIHSGLILRYRVRPILGVPLSWVTEITHAVQPRLFVDEQRFGPYLFWHHQHLFHEAAGGTVNEDVVHYAIGWGPLGRLLHRLVVRKKLEAIFDYRQRVLQELFPLERPFSGSTASFWTAGAKTCPNGPISP